MPEPTSTAAGTIGASAIIGLASGYLGPQAGPIVAIGVAGFVGALISMGDADTGGRWGPSLLHLAKYTALSCIVSGSIAAALSGAIGVPAIELVLIAATLVGIIGHRWRSLGASAANALGAFLQRKSDGGAS
jgi:hypothetical protein